MSDPGARAPATVTRIAVTVEILDRWAVAAPADPWEAIDQPLHLDPRSGASSGARLVHLPGTSLAGSLRAHLGDAAEAWMGRGPGGWEESSGTLEHHAGRLCVLGVDPIAVATVQRGVTAVSSASGAAAAGGLRFEQSAAPTSCTLLIEHAGTADTDLLDTLARWAPHVGRARTSGMGRGRVRRVRSVTVDLARSADLSWWLTCRDSWPTEAEVPESMPTTDWQATEDLRDESTDHVFDWQVREPIHVGADPGEESPDDGQQAAPTLTSTGRGLVPGSSWKGVFRHRVHVILAVCGTSTPETNGIVGWLFGSPAGRGQLVFRDSLAPAGSLLGRRTHVAIDRFTGGGADGQLFAVQSIAAGTTLRQRIGWAHGEMPARVVDLLRCVARDIHDGLIGVGGGGGRGYGWLVLTDAQLAAVSQTGGVDVHALAAAASAVAPQEVP